MAFNHHAPADFPKPKPKPPTIHLEETTVIPRYEHLFGVTQIPKGKWWADMWEFPRFEKKDQKDVVAEHGSSTRYLGTVNYSVTKHRIRLAVYSTRYGEAKPSLRWETLDGLKEIAMPAPQVKAFKLLSRAQDSLDY